jgi:hypothetical protein
MPITQAFCNVAKRDFLGGVHAAGDVYKLALFSDAATLNADTTAYAATGEISGTGYTAGGVTLAGRANSLVGTVGILDWNDAQWVAATFSGARGALLYNSSKSNAAIAVLNFGSDRAVTAGTFTVQFPNPSATEALIRVA